MKVNLPGVFIQLQNDLHFSRDPSSGVRRLKYRLVLVCFAIMSNVRLPRWCLLRESGEGEEEEEGGGVCESEPLPP